MARVIYSEAALSETERLTAFLVNQFPAEAPNTVGLITAAVAMLEHLPLIGRPITREMCELVISRGRSGDSASYSLEARGEVALILRICHQHEAGDF